MKNRYILFLAITTQLSFGLVGCGEKKSNNQQTQQSELKINQIQVLGTHNSYAQPVDEQLLEYVSNIVDDSKQKMKEAMTSEQLAFFQEYHPNKVSFKEGLMYDHPSFEIQLDSGLRSLELDVYYDSTGNRFNKPAGYEYLKKQGITNLKQHNIQGLDEKGFKVLHIADIDFRSKYPTLKSALESIKKWSESNKGHVPLFIMIEAKDSNWPMFENPSQVLKYDQKAFDLLDQEIIEVLGRDKIITPDDIRGDFPTLREAVLAHNWPFLSESRGKVLFMLLPSTAGLNQTDSAYVKGRPNLEGRMMFVQSNPSDTYGAFLLLDNAIVRQEEIKDFVKKGYLVRTRSDIDTYEAKINDYSRANAAFSSGAQVISTDYFSKEHNPYQTDYVVKIPGDQNDMRINPINGN